MFFLNLSIVSVMSIFLLQYALSSSIENDKPCPDADIYCKVVIGQL